MTMGRQRTAGGANVGQIKAAGIGAARKVPRQAESGNTGQTIDDKVTGGTMTQTIRARRRGEAEQIGHRDLRPGVIGDRATGQHRETPAQTRSNCRTGETFGGPRRPVTSGDTEAIVVEIPVGWGEEMLRGRPPAPGVNRPMTKIMPGPRAVSGVRSGSSGLTPRGRGMGGPKFRK